VSQIAEKPEKREHPLKGQEFMNSSVFPWLPVPKIKK
jgi:hypothetical protein